MASQELTHFTSHAISLLFLARFLFNLPYLTYVFILRAFLSQWNSILATYYDRSYFHVSVKIMEKIMEKIANRFSLRLPWSLPYFYMPPQPSVIPPSVPPSSPFLSSLSLIPSTRCYWNQSIIASSLFSYRSPTHYRMPSPSDWKSIMLDSYVLLP